MVNLRFRIYIVSHFDFDITFCQMLHSTQLRAELVIKAKENDDVVFVAHHTRTKINSNFVHMSQLLPIQSCITSSINKD